ncbi:MAG: class I SAM-dependent methyltransferase [Spirochaetales bacterium]|nr:class I SAM-dependent methyltransferase [Spirochaetales bacterium]
MKNPRRPEDRFSGLSDDYRKYRPGYPREIIDTLAAEYGLKRESVMADVGSGTGKLTKLFLDSGCRVYGVEPNEDMRREAERAFAGRGNFVSVNGTAERTGLPDRSVDLIAAGTAFHWFDVARTKREFARIRKPRGAMVLVWNVRDENEDFMREYDRLIRTHIPEYELVGFHLDKRKEIMDFFKPAEAVRREFPNRQRFDRGGLLGRVRSTSYCPKEGTPEYERLAAALSDLFDEWQTDATIEFTYQTVMYAARFAD